MVKAKSTAQLQQELDELLLWFDSETIDLDEALSKYENGKQLIVELETRLKKLENKIIKIQKN